MLAAVKEEVRDLSDYSLGTSHNQVETMRVEDVCVVVCSRISALEKPNNPANKSLWSLVNLLVSSGSRISRTGSLPFKDLRAELASGKERVGVLEMSSAMIRSRVLRSLEEAMEIDPPVTDLSGDDDSTDSEYADVDDGGAMLVEDLAEEGDRENMAPDSNPSSYRSGLDTPPPAYYVSRELIPIEGSCSALSPVLRLLRVRTTLWYIPPIHASSDPCHLSEFSVHQAPVDPVPAVC
jgi:hypothetical protein